PYLAPPPNRVKRNEPAFFADTSEAGADVFSMSYNEFASQVEENFERLFTKVPTWQN
ncbi:MAG: TatD family hydrolase, partial [Boseongicola sp.]|nr:TatD family hydrolase [Boseongicola sp.]